MYLVTGTRPDLAFTISKLAQFSSKPTAAHTAAAKRALRYIKKTRDLKLTYRPCMQPCSSSKLQPLDLQVYADADFAGDKDDRKSYSGYVVMLGNSSICWRSRKQRVTATSTVEAE